MKHLKVTFIILSVVLLFVMLFTIIEWFYAGHKIERICGEWMAVKGKSSLFITLEKETYVIVSYFRDRNGRVHIEKCPLFYRGCIGFKDSHGRRIDIFVNEMHDKLLLYPGGSYRRKTVSNNNH